MSPGRIAYERKPRPIKWDDLTDDVRATWECGAAMPPVDGRLDLTQGEQRTER